MTIQVEGKITTINIQNNSNVTIVDSSEEEGGKVISSGDYDFAVCVDGGASVIIDGGTYENFNNIALKVQGDNSSVTINGGSYISSNIPVEIGEGCSATIAGGTFKYADNGAIRNFGNLVVKGGTFTYNGESIDAPYSTIDYFGGSIDFSDYPTIEGISSIIVSHQFEMDIVPSAETILLPKGYCFFEVKEGTPVTMLVQNWNYYIGEEPAQYTITFVVNGGGDEMEDVIVYEGDYTLPECAFTAPEGMMFKAWQIGEEEYQPGDVVTIKGKTTITALWYVPQIVIKMHDSARDGWHGDAIVVKKNGKEIGTATIEEGADGIVSYYYDITAEYTFYWSCNHEQELENDPFYECWPQECSFEIFIDDEEVFAAIRDEEEGISDCVNYVDGELLYSIEGEEIVVEELTIADGELTEYSNDASFTTVGTLTYTRTLPNQMWNSLYVPFEIEVTEELLEDYELAYANNFHAYDSDEDGEIDDLEMEIIKIKAGTLHANYPYFIRAKSEAAQELTLTMEDATLYATKEQTITCQSFYTGFSLTGTYNRMYSEEFDNADGQCYAISTEGIWQPIAEGAYLNPFRVYMTITDLDNSPVKVNEAALTRVRIRVAGDGATTGIGEVKPENGATEIYDLSGRRVAQPQKGGIYIVNGKKVVL